MNFCKDCKHVLFSTGGEIQDDRDPFSSFAHKFKGEFLCAHEKTTRYDCVTGGRVYWTAKYMRTHGACGKGATLFEPKENSDG